MANGGSSLLLSELRHIQQLLKQLDRHLSPQDSDCRLLASEIFSLTERSIGMANSTRKRPALSQPPETASPGGPRMGKRRKGVPTKTLQLRASPGGGDKAAPVDDGRSWRKYGQKSILGAKHPREYFRCPHRGCMAKKKVQRCDHDLSLFDVVYLGEHVCDARSAATDNDSPVFEVYHGGQPPQPTLEPWQDMAINAQGLAGSFSSPSPASDAGEYVDIFESLDGFDIGMEFTPPGILDFDMSYFAVDGLWPSVFEAGMPGDDAGLMT